MLKVRDLGEFGLIKRIGEIAGSPGGSVLVGIGDDAAVIAPTDKQTVLTSDMLVEGVHFRFDWMSPREVGYKSIAVNVSDIAAMAARPAYALISIGIAPAAPASFVEEFYQGAQEACKEYGITIIGGDTNRSERFIASITLVGFAGDPPIRTRSEAVPGEAILVTGLLGASAAGLKMLEQPELSGGLERDAKLIDTHKRPSARVEAASVISQLGGRAMEDISDGLAGEVAHIAEMSGVGARLFAESIPLAPGVARLAIITQTDPLEFALFGGEDYELVFTAPREAVSRITTALARLGLPVTQVGETIGEQKVVLVENGIERPLERKGFTHF